MTTPDLSVETDGLLNDTVSAISSTVESTDTVLDNMKATNRNFRIDTEKEVFAKIHPCF